MTTNKKILIGVSSAIIITAGIIAIIKISKNRRLKNDCEDANGDWDRKKGICVSDSGSLVVTTDQTKSDIGRTVNVHPTLGYTNVRSSPKLDDGAVGSWFGYRLGGNFIGEATTNPIGTITQSVKGDDEYNWYKIKLTKSLDGKSSGYVREDAISFT